MNTTNTEQAERVFIKSKTHHEICTLPTNTGEVVFWLLDGGQICRESHPRNVRALVSVDELTAEIAPAVPQ